MRAKVKLCKMTKEEESEVRKLANSQNASAKLVKRANILVNMLDTPDLNATDAGIRAGFSSGIGAVWVKRFNEKGIVGLEDKQRSGRKPIHDEKVRSRLVSLALQKPRTIGYPFELWTLERLQNAFNKEYEVNLAQSTILNWLAAEGFKWKRQQSWFQDIQKHDPEFVEKRGSSSAVISSHLPIHE